MTLTHAQPQAFTGSIYHVDTRRRQARNRMAGRRYGFDMILPAFCRLTLSQKVGGFRSYN